MKELFTEFAKLIGKLVPFSALRRMMLNCYYPLVRGKTVFKTVNGINYNLDLDEVIEVSMSLGIYEYKIQSFLKSLCKPGMTVLDIGANVGAHALPLSKWVSTEGIVYAFEPTDYAYKKLKANIELNPLLSITAVQVALSDHDERNVKIDFRSSWCTNGQSKNRSSVVDFVRLDHWVQDHGLVRKIDLIKMDVDGNEMSVLLGGQNTILRDHPIFVMEVAGYHFKNRSNNPIAWLWDRGWHFKPIVGANFYQSIDEIEKQLSPKDLEFSINVIGTYYND